MLQIQRRHVLTGNSFPRPITCPHRLPLHKLVGPFSMSRVLYTRTAPMYC